MNIIDEALEPEMRHLLQSALDEFARNHPEVGDNREWIKLYNYMNRS